MASLIPGYNYDIFISYLQKDKSDDNSRSEFVEALKTELESTFKEEISVYFDINPHDGLLETHSVNRSLEDKLKCLIFIPIISRTYCDPKSFAWEHEFVAFNKIAKEDRFGRDIRLTSGNVASRILPVKIHDLDPEDKALLENELGGVLRGIEFIYKSAGVNRPLRANEDHPQDNINKTYYRDNINKVANAVKEITAAVKKYYQQDGEVPKEVVKTNPEKSKNLKPKIIIASFVLFVLILLGYFIIPTRYKSEEQLEKTIAVLPFRNLSNDTTQLYFCDGFMEEILNNLQKINSFTVRSRTSSEQYRDTKKSLTVIGNELNVNYLIEGSVGREGDNLKIWVQLIDSKADKHVWSNDYTRESKQIFSLQSEIAKNIASELKTVLTAEEKELIDKRKTQNPEAYNLYLQGRFFWNKRTEAGQKKSIEYFEKSVSEDPDFALAFAGLADAYFILSWYGWFPKTEGYTKAKKFVLRAIEIDKDLAEAHATLGAILCWNEWKWEESRKELLHAIMLNRSYATGYQYYSELLDILGETNEARKQINIALELDPLNTSINIVSAIIYQREGKLNEYVNEWRKAQEIEPEKTLSFYWVAFFINLKQGNDSIALEYLQKILPKNASAVKNVYIKSGMNGIINWLIDQELKKPEPNLWTLTGQYYAWQDNKEEALKALEKAQEVRASRLPRINNDPDFDYLRSEPRFQALIKKFGLTEYQKRK